MGGELQDRAHPYADGDVMVEAGDGENPDLIPAQHFIVQPEGGQRGAGFGLGAGDLQANINVNGRGGRRPQNQRS